MPDDRLAVLIDADNTSPKHAAAILGELARFGRATVKRAYGDWTTSQLGGWKTALNQHAIAPVQQFAYTTGKNATDSTLIIDAMDLLYSGSVDAFALVSSDSDFTRLATRLRESGKSVYGLGLRKTPASLVAAVDRFVFLDLLDKPRETTDEPNGESADEPNDSPPDLKELLTGAVERAAGDDGWARLGTVGSQLRAAYAAFDPRLYDAKQLITLVRAQDYLTVETNGSVTRVSVTDVAPAARKRTTRKRTPAKRSATTTG